MEAEGASGAFSTLEPRPDFILLFPPMALSAHDKEFYEEKLRWKSFGILLGATMLVGMIAWPTLIYLQDWSNGDTSKWSGDVAFKLSMMGFLLGMVVSTVMYLLLKFFLEMGWLPKRR